MRPRIPLLAVLIALLASCSQLLPPGTVGAWVPDPANVGLPASITSFTFETSSGETGDCSTGDWVSTDVRTPGPTWILLKPDVPGREALGFFQTGDFTWQSGRVARLAALLPPEHAETFNWVRLREEVEERGVREWCPDSVARAIVGGTFSVRDLAPPPTRDVPAPVDPRGWCRVGGGEPWRLSVGVHQLWREDEVLIVRVSDSGWSVSRYVGDDPGDRWAGLWP